MYSNFAFLNSFFGVVKLTKNSDLDNHSYYRNGTEIDTRGTFSLSSGSGFGKNVIRYWVDNSYSLNADNGKKLSQFLVNLQQMN